MSLSVCDEATVDVAHAAALGTVEDVGLRRLDEVGFDEGFLHEVLDALDRGRALDGAGLELFDHFVGDLVGRGAVLHGARCLERLLHRVGDLFPYGTPPFVRRA